MAKKTKKRFYVTETLDVGHWVDASNKTEARAIVETKPGDHFDILESNKIINIKVVDAARAALGEGKE